MVSEPGCVNYKVPHGTEAEIELETKFTVSQEGHTSYSGSYTIVRRYRRRCRDPHL